VSIAKASPVSTDKSAKQMMYATNELVHDYLTLLHVTQQEHQHSNSYFTSSLPLFQHWGGGSTGCQITPTFQPTIIMHSEG